MKLQYYGQCASDCEPVFGAGDANEEVSAASSRRRLGLAGGSLSLSLPCCTDELSLVSVFD